MLAKRLTRLESGEYAILVDLEVLNEQVLASSGGFSISHSRNTRRYGKGEPKFEVHVNPKQFDFVQASEIVYETVGSTAFDVTEKIEHAGLLVTAIIAVTAFVGAEFAGGFIKAAGADVYQALRTKLRRKDAPSGPVVFHFELSIQVGPHTPLLILVVPSDVPSAFLSQIDQDALAPLLSGLDPDRVPARIVVSMRPNGQLFRDRVIYSS
jgi:hypothetical protein